MATGSVLFYANVNQITEDNANFHWKDATDRLGIGTDNPSYTLDITDDAANPTIQVGKSTSWGILRLLGSGGTAILEQGASGDGLIISAPTSNAIRFMQNETTEYMRVHTNGNVGIGIISPSFKLDLEGTGATGINALGTATVALRPSADNVYPALLLQTRNAGTFGGAGLMALNDTNYDSNLIFFTNPAGSTTRVERMRITKDGKVGIGTASPSYKLHVANSGTDTGLYSETSGITNAKAGVLGKANADGGVGVRGETTSRGVSGGSSMGLYGIVNTTSNAQGGAAFGIFAKCLSGKDPVDSVSAPAGAYFQGLEDGASNLSKICFGAFAETWSTHSESAALKATLKKVAGGTSPAGMALHAEVPDSTGVVARFSRGSSHLMTILGGGNVGISKDNPGYLLELGSNSAAKPGGGQWTDSSCDLRLKKDIEPFTDGLGVVQQINPVSYRYNGKGGLPIDTPAIGVIAQDVKDVAPYTVGTRKLKLNPEDEEEEDVYDFNGSALMFVLINAVKELSTRVEALEKQ